MTQPTDVEPDEAAPEPTYEDSPFIASDRGWWSETKGFRAVYQLDDVPPWEAVLTNLSGPLTTHNLAGMRTKRHGGPHPSDFALQRLLVQILGAVTLVSGHIEMEMKRILLTAKAEPESGFSDVDLTWKGLEDALNKVAKADTPLAEKLRPVLEWGAEQKVRERRNDMVHTAWCLFETGHIEGARLAHSSDGVTIIDKDGRLASIVGTLWEYLNRLQRVVPWPIAVLPPLGDDAPSRIVEVEVSATDG